MRILFLIGLVIGCGCNKISGPGNDDSPARAAKPAEADLAVLAKSNNQFAFDLWHRLAAPPGNLAISPFSITTALAMAWRGAQGETAAQMRAVLHAEADAAALAPRWGQLSRALADPDRPITLRIANRLFGEVGYPFKRAFLDDTRSAFGAPLEPISFSANPNAALAHINDWVEQRTEHRIKNVLGPSDITKETRLVLVNAIYFLADWARAFQKDATTDQNFLIGETSKRVKTMHAVASYRYVRSDDVALLEMPYKGNDMAMLVLLPDRTDGVADLERTLDATKLAAWTAALKPVEVRVSLPRFTIDPAEPVALAEHLSALGMPAAFDPNVADFTDMATPPDPAERLYISRVAHKAFVRVDEQGTEAAAATAAVMTRLTETWRRRRSRSPRTIRFCSRSSTPRAASSCSSGASSIRAEPPFKCRPGFPSAVGRSFDDNGQREIA